MVSFPEAASDDIAATKEGIKEWRMKSLSDL